MRRLPDVDVVCPIEEDEVRGALSAVGERHHAWMHACAARRRPCRCGGCRYGCCECTHDRDQDRRERTRSHVESPLPFELIAGLQGPASVAAILRTATQVIPDHHERSRQALQPEIRQRPPSFTSWTVRPAPGTAGSPTT